MTVKWFFIFLSVFVAFAFMSDMVNYWRSVEIAKIKAQETTQ